MQRKLVSLIALVALAPAACLDTAEPEDDSRTALIDFGDGPVPVTFVDEGGWATVDDMVLGRTADVETNELVIAPLVAPVAPDGVIFSAIRTRAWPKGRVPYRVDSDLSAFVKVSIANAIATWNATGAVTMVPFKPSDTTILEFRPPDPGMNMGLGEGRAMVGYNANDALRLVWLGGWMSTAGVIHEIGHAIGLKHEQQRRDRDTFVDINWDNIREGKEGNFDMFGSSSQYLEFGAYDFNSIMHYNSFSFADDPSEATIVRSGCSFTNVTSTCEIRRDSEPTAGDVRGVFRVHAGPSFMLRNDHNERCLRPSGGSTAAGKPVITSTCSNTRSRRWFQYDRPGGGSWLVNENSRLCLTAPNVGSSANGMTQQPCSSLATQLFDINAQGSGYQIRMRGSNRCVRRISSQSQVILSTSCSATSSRRWKK